MMATNLIPAQLTGRDFLCASHYSISNDERFIPQSFKSTFHSDYVPPKEKLKPPPALPPIPANFMHKDSEKINMKVSETTQSYLEKKSILDDTRDKYSSLYKTNFKMNSDAKIPTFQTTHDLYYRPKPILTTHRSNLGTYWTRSSFPQGDKEKADEPLSNYKASFLGHDMSSTPRQQTTSQHWSTNTITGDKQHRFMTTHDSTFVGQPVNPPPPVPKHTFSSIPEGDKEKVVEKTTTMKFSYQPNEGNHQPKHSTDSHTKIYATNFDLTDRHGTFDKYKSTQSESYHPLHMTDSRVKRDRDRNASDIPEGDLDPYRSHQRINATVARSHHVPFDPRSCMAPRVSGADKRTASNVKFGEKELAHTFYDTTCDSTFKAVSVPFSKADSHPDSVVPLKYYGDMKTSPTTISDFPHHDVKQKPYRFDLEDLRATHFDQPLGGERYFGTSHNLHYTPKKIDKLEVDRGRLQRSSLPIGTLGKYIKGCNTGM